MTGYGARIKAARHAAGLTVAQLAARLGVSRGAVSAWEAERRDPGVAGLLRVAAALGVPGGSLLAAAAPPRADPLRDAYGKAYELAASLAQAIKEADGR